MSDRFIIDCYGIVDTWRKGNQCKDIKLSWLELCNLLNTLDKAVDKDKQELLLEIDELKKENKNLRMCINEIYLISSTESID